MANQEATRQSAAGKPGGGELPLDDLTYDLVTVLYEKSKGMAAYDKYIRDAQSDPEAKKLFEQMRQQDEECVGKLCERLGLEPKQGGRR